MAVIQTGGSGNWSSTTVNAPWTTGVPPVLGDSVIINTGHTVTVDGTYNPGDDTATAIQVFGTLKASRAVSSLLTVRGKLFITTGGTLDYGTEADPIPSSVTAFIAGNDSATQAHNKWGIETDPTNSWAGFRMWGASKTLRTQVTSPALSTDTTITVGSTTGWQVNDVLVFDGTAAENVLNSYRGVKIVSIAGNNVTVSAALGFASLVGRQVINLTRNVGFYGINGNTWRTQVSIRVPTAFSTTNAIELGYCEFRATGGSASSWELCGLNMYWQANGTTTACVKKITGVSAHNAWSISGSAITPIVSNGSALVSFFSNQAYQYTFDNPTIFSYNGNQNSFLFYSGTVTKLTNVNAIRASNFAACGFSQGPVSAVISGGYASLMSNFITSTGQKLYVDNLTVDGLFNYGNLVAASDFKITSSTFNQVIGRFGSTNMWPGTNGQRVNYVWDGCTINPDFFTITSGASLFNTAITDFLLKFRNVNNDPLQNREYKYGGLALRDNSVTNRSTSSLALYPWYANIPISKTQTITVAAGQTILVKGYCRYNTTYGTSSAPTLTISGLGATPVTFTCPTTGADTWYPISLSITNPQSYPGDFTLTFTGQSSSGSTSATCYFDGILITDFVTSARHYGYVFDSNAYRTVNPYITQTNEATVGAYTGISINTGTSTITLTSNHSIQEIYDYTQWYLCQTANLSVTPFLSTADGVNFTSTYNLTLNGGSITGTGALNLGTSTFTRAGSETSTLPITYNSGANVFTSVTVSGLVANSRVRVNNTTDNIELYNAVVTGTSVTLPVTWTANKSLDVRVTNVIGTTAYLPYQTSGTLTSAGASFTASQALDTVYNSNAIDGSTVTEFATDYPNLQVDLSSGSSTTVQRLYNWYQYATHTSQGIVYYFNGINAKDTNNYVIRASTIALQLDNTSANNIKITGGYLTRDDGGDIIYPLTAKSINAMSAPAYIADSNKILNNTNLIPALL